MKQSIIALLSLTNLLSLNQCGGLSQPEHASLSTRQPYVLASNPTEGMFVSLQPEISLTFSVEILSESLTDDTIFFIRDEAYTDWLASADDWQDLQSDVLDGDIESIPIEILSQPPFDQVRVRPIRTLNASDHYQLIIFPTLMSIEHLPLNQTQAGSAQAHFVCAYHTSHGGSGDGFSESADFGAGTVGEEGGTPSDPNLENLPPREPFDRNRILITEVITDPQQDHNDTAGGTGFPFDSNPGTGTIGTTDEYIEIYNGTETRVDLTGWQVTMADGSDVTQSLDAASWTRYFSAGGTLTDFAPDEYLVLGNPDGDLKNTITVTLLDDETQIVDEVIFEDANADSVADESWFRNDDGDWVEGVSSPGY